ncbi:antibiotic biosynthesis monooxygenase [Actinoallomurus vinaceus]|uniref:Antibiotic biosynthesis monooxygenase n=1 Tax=Actinoallomurus vinaceus TaxID=1080074 RepID=A0ABP8USI5_9ACTN
MTGRVRVIVYYAASEEDVTEAYERANKEMRGTPGLLGAELLRSMLDGDRFAVLSEWTSRTAFLAWEQGARHRDQTSALRPYEDHAGGRSYTVYEVIGEL